MMQSWNYLGCFMVQGLQFLDTSAAVMLEQKLTSNNDTKMNIDKFESSLDLSAASRQSNCIGSGWDGVNCPRSSPASAVLCAGP